MNSEESAKHEAADFIDTTIKKISLQDEKLIPSSRSYVYSLERSDMRGTIKLPRLHLSRLKTKQCYEAQKKRTSDTFTINIEYPNTIYDT